MRGIDILYPVLLAAAIPMQALAGPKLPGGFIEKRVGTGLSDPAGMAFGPDGSGWAADRGGKVYRIVGDTLSGEAALTLAVDTTGERGLLGLALDPAASAPKLYLAYCTQQATGVQIRLSAFPIEAGRLDAAKEVQVMVIPISGGATAGLGGGLALGADGKLYLGVGDLQQPELAQDVNAVNGKVLRIGANGFIPADNPFYATATGQGKAVWALGLGDPSGLAFNAAGSLYANDTKAGSYQEVNAVVAGGNYGWPTATGPSQDVRFKAPLYAYASGEGCSSRAGDFHAAGRARFPAEFVGDYFTADVCGGWIRRVLPGTGERKDFIDGFAGPAALKFGPLGDLYYATRGLGEIYKLSYAPELAIRILSEPQDVVVQEGESITFRIQVEGPQPLTYQWRKNGVDIPDAVSSSLTLGSATLEYNGVRFSVRVTNPHGSVESRAALVTVGKNIFAPKIVTQPVDITVRNGKAAAFSVVVDGTPPFTYLWHRKGVPIPGATAATYNIASAPLSESGTDYFVEISNAGGLITSRRAILTVVNIGINALAEVHKATVMNGRGPIEADMSNGESEAGDGDMISIGDKLYDRGIGVYANSEVDITLSGGCDSLYAEIGVDGERGTTGTVVFEVLADGASLYKGPLTTVASPPVKLALLLTGKNLLKLKVTNAGDASGNDYANWADARIKCWENFSGIREGIARRPAGRKGWYILGPGDASALSGLPASASVRIYDMQGRVVLPNLGPSRMGGPDRRGSNPAAGMYPIAVSDRADDPRRILERKP